MLVSFQVGSRRTQQRWTVAKHAETDIAVMTKLITLKSARMAVISHQSALRFIAANGALARCNLFFDITDVKDSADALTLYDYMSRFRHEYFPLPYQHLTAFGKIQKDRIMGIMVNRSRNVASDQ